MSMTPHDPSRARPEPAVTPDAPTVTAPPGAPPPPGAAADLISSTAGTGAEPGSLPETVLPAAAPQDDVSTRAPSPARTPRLPAAPAAASATALPSSVGDYDILGELGRGAMGVVYRAAHRQLKRTVALKMILSGVHAGPEDLARFRTEAEAIARLQHPNIVQVFEVGEEQGRPFFSLEFTDGGSLSRKIAATPQPPRLAAGLVAVLARAMQAAHQANIIHRDLKPSNVLLSRKPDAPPPAEEAGDLREPPLDWFEPKIADFGLAKRLDTDSAQTRSDAVMGTPSYMAPEQARGEGGAVGPAADIYALAAILYELLTGRPPFKGATPWETLEQVRTQEPVPPARLQPKVPRDLETICLKGLRKDARQRYASARALADDLQRWLDGRPILARPVPPWERAWKWARRRPALAALAAALLLAVAGLGTGAVFFGLYERQQLQSERQRLARSQAISELWAGGQNAEAAGNFDEANEKLTRALALLDSPPAAADDEETRRRLDEGIERVRRRRELWANQQGLLADRQRFAEARARFDRHRDEALFRSVSLRDRDALAGAGAVRQEARSALGELGLAADDPAALAAGLDRFRGRVEEGQLRQTAEDCAEVLLVWADAEAAAPDPDGGPRQALRLLDGAAALSQAHGLEAPRALSLRRAKYLELLKDPDGARAAHARADGMAPATALDHFEAALDDYRAGRLPEAVAACEEALQRRPDHFWAQYVKALCYLRAKRWGEAKVGLTYCLRHHPGYTWLLPLLGTAHAELGEYDAAERVFQQALQAGDDPALRATALTNRSALRLKQGRPDGAEKDLLEAIALQPTAPQGYVNRAQALERRGDHAGAARELTRALGRSPANPAPLFFQRGQLRARAGDRAEARQDFEEVIARDAAGGTSDLALRARVALAHLRLLAGESDRALADCDAVLKVRPSFAEAHRQRAEALLALKRHKEAGAALDSYLKAGGKPTAKTYRARGLIHQEYREYGPAVAAYTRALWLEEDAPTLSDRGWAYLLEGAAQPALDDFDAALAREPKSPDALAGRATALVLRGRRADVRAALTDAEAALRAAPPTVPRLMTCARSCVGAAGLLQSAAPRAADEPDAERCLGRAVELLREARALEPPDKRDAFWRDKVLTDPVFRPLQRGPVPQPLARSVAQ
jgi:tetratricopeptide (TPR) repeat protein